MNILQTYIPNEEVWAFGSRVIGKSKKFSDLDLVIKSDTPLPTLTQFNLKEAFSEFLARSIMITIVDLGMGNLHSVKNVLSNVAPGQTVKVTADPQQILDAERVVLPGQGAVGTGFRAYESLNLSAAINDAIDNKPLLGICIGQQAMYQSSDEDGGVSGFGLFDGKVRHFSQFHKPGRDSKH